MTEEDLKSLEEFARALKAQNRAAGKPLLSLVDAYRAECEQAEYEQAERVGRMIEAERLRANDAVEEANRLRQEVKNQAHLYDAKCKELERAIALAENQQRH